MSKPLSEYSDETWTRFIDWLYDAADAEPLTDEEVKQRLDEAGIDMRPAYERLHQLLDRHRRTTECPPVPPSLTATRS